METRCEMVHPPSLLGYNRKMLSGGKVSPFSVLLVLCSLPILAAPQVASSTAPKDPGALLLVQNSLQAMGGPNLIGHLPAVTATGTLTQYNGTALPYKGVVSVENSTFEVRKETGSGSDLHVFATGHGRPGYQGNGRKARPLYQHVTMLPPFEFPGLVLYVELQNPSLAFSMIAGSVTDPPHLEISSNEDPVTAKLLKQEWYFDPVTFLPLYVTYVIPSNLDALTTFPARCTYVSFAGTSEGFRYPSPLQLTESGENVGQLSFDSVTLGAVTNESLFDLDLGDKQ